MLGLLRSLGGGIQLFQQLLALAQTGVKERDIGARLVAVEPDHLLGQLLDGDALSHVQKVDLASGSDPARLQDEGRGLRNGHEVPAGIRMRDRHRSALEDLAAEKRQDASAGTQDIAESDNQEMTAVPALPQDDLLRQQLGGAIHGAGLHRLVGGDEHESLHAALSGRIHDVLRSKDVVLHRFDGIGLHQWHVLVGGSVEHDVRARARQDEMQVVPVLHLADDRHEGRLLPDALFLEQAQLVLDCVDAVLPVAEQVQPLRAALQELTAELGPDAPAGAGHEHPLAPHVCEAPFQIHAHRVTGQEVLGIDLARLDEVRLAVEYLRDLGHDADPGEIGPTEDGIDLCKLLPRRAGDRDDRLVRGCGPDHAGGRLDRPQHGDPVDAAAYLHRVVVQECDHPAEDPLGPDLSSNCRAGEARADDVDGVARIVRHYYECR